ncbi:beta/gamma crystallin-related protein [Zooshikella harenae]|uniref:Beta/gamma crystallin 'Greek key' domain-containing protein n=1 Tax=Zooshikella harenae TaxID=2827238 RepID=A0ABS5ZA51_9GAMM|nr:beta/gamma crystallin-related protein [Zooshikella harenae]MBU2710942.1 hypothetical protein [Zooshikella harenae]
MVERSKNNQEIILVLKIILLINYESILRMKMLSKLICSSLVLFGTTSMSVNAEELTSVSSSSTSDPTDMVKFYADTKYRGNEYTYPAGEYSNVEHVVINGSSSVKVPNGHFVELYNGTNFTGKKYIFSKDNSNFRDYEDINDNIKSFKLIKGNPDVCFHVDTRLEGREACYRHGDQIPELKDYDLNDSFSSVKFFNENTKVIAYEQRNFTSEHKEYFFTQSRLNDWNDNIVSLKVLANPISQDEKQFLNSIQTKYKLNELLSAYNPVWNFWGGSTFFPIDIDQSFEQFNDLQHLECDEGKWRLIYNSGVAKNYPEHTNSQVDMKAYGFAQLVERGINLHYYLYFPYNVGHELSSAYDHEGDWEGAIIHLRPVRVGSNFYLRPMMLKTNAHGNEWKVDWDSSEVWTAQNGQYIGDTNIYKNELGADILPPRLFVAKKSNGIYPNTNHEHSIISFPSSNDHNRTCVDANVWPLCDYIETPDDVSRRIRLPLAPILVNKSNNGNIEFLRLYSQQKVKWLNRDSSCQAGTKHTDMTNIPNGVWRWGKHDGPTGVQFRKDFDNTIPGVVLR